MPELWQKKAEQWLEHLKAWVRSDKKRINLLVVLGMVGMILLCVSEWIPSGTVEEPNGQTASVPLQAREQNYASELEQRLQQLIEAVEGAGQCRVMVTLSSGEETVYATDTEQGETTSRSEHVLLGEEALIERVQTPEIQGVAVLCEGGGNAAVRNTITELVRALTGVGANHITVTKMVTAK